MADSKKMAADLHGEVPLPDENPMAGRYVLVPIRNAFGWGTKYGTRPATDEERAQTQRSLGSQWTPEFNKRKYEGGGVE